ncbi:hypothetical protein HAX54_012330 [Datura stramonium]|uniref:Uncharacterized protein n=1 Tax=Datura stramonium TaxID=4076 RepID=A0ABS8TLJ1_DATST|nr:hypothetical protein [Datura stramonium]
MADQITVIDLVENEFDYKEKKSYQKKIAKLEAKVAQMEQEIGGIKKMITELKKSSIEESAGHSPICTTSYPNIEIYIINSSNFQVTMMPNIHPPAIVFPFNENKHNQLAVCQHARRGKEIQSTSHKDLDMEIQSLRKAIDEEFYLKNS